MNIPTIVTRSVTTLLIGGLSFVLTNAAGQSTESTVTISVFIGGVVLVVQYLAGFERSLARLAREQASSLARVNAGAGPGAWPRMGGAGCGCIGRWRSPGAR